MKSILALLTLLAVLGLSAAGVAAQDDPDTYLLGFIGASEGPQAAQDRAAYQAAVLAAESFNAEQAGDDPRTTPDGTRYLLDVRYYEADSAEDAADAYADALEDAVIAVLGLHQDSHLDAVLAANTLTIPLLTAQEGAATATNLIRLRPTQALQTQALASYLTDERYFDSFAVVAADTESAQDGAAVFSDTVGADQIALTLTHAADETDFSADARSIRDAGVEAVFVWTLDAQGVRLLEALEAVGWRGQIAYMELDEAFVRTAGAQAAEVIGVASWTAQAYDAASQAFTADYGERWGQAPTALDVPYYDAVNWIAEAVAVNGESVGTLSSVAFTGVQGEYAGGASDTVRLLQADAAGLLSELARYSGAAGAQVCATCADFWSEDISSAVFDTSAIYTLALIASLDGVNEATGLPIRQAAELAVREINDAGGFVGADGVRYRLQLLVYSATTSAETQQAFEQAMAAGAQMMIGPDFNAQVLPNLSLAESAGTAQMVSATGLSSNLVSVPASVFQLRPNDATLAAAAVDYVLNVRDLTEIATVAVRTDYGLDTTRVIQEAVADSDAGRLVLSLEHDVNAPDAAALAGEIAGSTAEAVFVWSTQPYAADLITALDEAGWGGTVIYGYLTQAFVDALALPESSPISLIGPASWWASAQDWSGREFTERYLARYDEMPAPQSAAYYDAVYMVRAALQNAAADTGAVTTWLTGSVDFTGVQGAYSAAVNSTDELSRSLMIVGVSAGEVVELARYQNETCVAWCE